jgi:hypothetical protein
MASPRRSKDGVYVRGLDDFRRELRRVEKQGGPDGRDLLKSANYKVATYVILKARQRAGSVGAIQARAASTMTAGQAQSRATITGGASVPYFYGAEFGAKHGILRRERKPAGWAGAGRWRGYNQFETWKQPGSGRAGYFLFPTMRAESRAIVEMYADELDDVMRDVFPD